MNLIIHSERPITSSFDIFRKGSADNAEECSTNSRHNQLPSLLPIGGEDPVPILAAGMAVSRVSLSKPSSSRLTNAEFGLGLLGTCAVAIGSYPMDNHEPSGTSPLIPVSPETGGAYGLPYGTLLPRELDNFPVAGGRISTTDEAQPKAGQPNPGGRRSV